MWWLGRKRESQIEVTFVPLHDITAYELAGMLARGWPVLVDTASGFGTVSVSFHVLVKDWATVPSDLQRHFEVAD